VVALINDEFVPVWINVRTTPLPDLACMDQVIEGIEYDADGYITGSFSQGFFLRSIVLASDGETLLNPQKSKAALGDLFSDGHFPYGQVKPKHYLPMLRESLDRARTLNQD
jgi:hypothetical protein